MDTVSADWLEHNREVLADFRPGPKATPLGRVERVSDGIALVTGLPDAKLNELLRFEGDRLGFVLTLDPDSIGAVLLDDGDAITASSQVTCTGKEIEVPVGPGLLGRVVDSLGRPIDRDEPVTAETHMPIERAAPAIIDRDLVTQPLETGILLVDALFPIGQGQRELIIGDRAMGKTSMALDAIINQQHSNVICIYVAVGQRATAVQRAVETVRQHGALDRCIFVVALASDSPGLQWIAPFSGMTMAEYFRDRGMHALIVIDDLTKHAATHRELALLTREPPGREAYPGDIFYLHARLLERAARLCAAKGGGSLSALPIAETDAGNLSAYIPTNLISITDGQIFLDSGLFAANQRPAVDIGLSVSRVGGKAQIPALRNVAGRMRLEYAQFLELEIFTRFGGLTDAHIKAQVMRGKRIRALMTQPRTTLLRPVDEVALLEALAQGVFDAYPVECLQTLHGLIGAHLDAYGPAPLRNVFDAHGELDKTMRSELVEGVRRLIARVAGDAAPESP
ncbi:F0F1 ATP synthase subunit alpha [Pandoraea communis]|uniref:ATP synthase subunit alpha n=1 Tax=Pandoraea communis TaxID=2508297 RepID=A0A5E4UTL0_9BURK|nr:F0F1 ATP synthase subunit alpha [Pandoraea communis]MDM8358075.1 F0F1 ATP synthase subunit alpha [Pandoraea communis]VVE02245.1 F0F1 ATP synthase subunit alpha [Pandoraea communis]